jgi:hypothetical protein
MPANTLSSSFKLNTRKIGRPGRSGSFSRVFPKLRWPINSSEITAARLHFNYSTAEDKYRHLQALNLNAGIKAKSPLE